MRLSPFLAILAVLTWTAYSVCAQTPNATAHLDMLLQQRHYVELELALLTRISALPPSPSIKELVKRERDAFHLAAEIAIA